MNNYLNHDSFVVFRILLRKYLLVIAGSMIQGFAMGVFLFPNSIPSGGAGGITVLLNYIFHIPASLALWLVNASMLVVAFRYLGSASTVGTLIGITVTSLSVQFFESNLYMPSPNVWIDLFIGSFFLGVGVAILMRQGVSQGGIGIIALIIAKSRRINPGKPLFWINGSIFIITGYIIDWKIVIQAIFCQWMSTQIVDWLYSLHIPRKTSFSALGWRRR
ncbi:YitT family protein [Anoxybacteroides tepidamans]|uniref:YitT family protein n=1 Tax=Anoxybacteroides tepidamans TaxID=265948 RepID=UPI000AB8D490|nr:YitT family protein [Anoxybacillus tepidamans]